ncbi:DUF6207 family protein [Streptomyces flaveus]|uniref:DUF6207 family protein n=1 Tax=Streptomyces flaveus TaxID=66370 RepID=UPI00332C674B
MATATSDRTTRDPGQPGVRLRRYLDLCQAVRPGRGAGRSSVAGWFWMRGAFVGRERAPDPPLHDRASTTSTGGGEPVVRRVILGYSPQRTEAVGWSLALAATDPVEREVLR